MTSNKTRPIESHEADTALTGLDILARTGGLYVRRDGGDPFEVDEIARVAAQLIREMRAHGDPELREAFETIAQLREEIAELEELRAATEAA